MNEISDPRYPIGKFDHEGIASSEQIAGWIDDIELLPRLLRTAVEPLSEAQLDTPYRTGGWTLRQVVHHIPDSHLNSYIRFKWALTEDEPLIKAYDEGHWAELSDYRLTPVEVSLGLLEQLHARWVVLLRGLSSEDLSRRYRHPEAGTTDLARTIGLYAWHGRHHLAHITATTEREGY